MDNLDIVESLSKTSAFNLKQNNKLLLELKNNLQMDDLLVDHLMIRAKISSRLEFVDAQADCHSL